MNYVIKPRVSEKSYELSQQRNTYVFEVPRNANKLSITQLIESKFEVNVVSVNISNLKGKRVRSVRKGGKVSNGSRMDVKKAYVTLKAGQSLPIFAVEEKDADKAAKAPAVAATTRTKKEKK